jgi:hypothetical protein
MTAFGLPALRLDAFAGDNQIPNLAKKPAEANKSAGRNLRPALLFLNR